MWQIFGMGTLRLTPNAENCSEEELRTAANCAPSRASHRRMMAILAIIKGCDSRILADVNGVTQETMRNWINCFNARGIDGLIEKKSPGAPRKIPPEKNAELRQIIKSPESAGEVHWTAKKFHGYLKKEHEIEAGYSTVLRWLHEENFCLKVPQSWSDRQDEDMRQALGLIANDQT